MTSSHLHIPIVPLVICECGPQFKSITLAMCTPTLTANEIIEISYTSTSNAFHRTKANPHRLIFALTGLVFDWKAPFTFGYSRISTSSVNELLYEMLSEAFKSYWTSRKANAISFIQAAVNKVLGLQYRGEKDSLDELLLRGMQKSGNLDCSGLPIIPEYLRHVQENRRNCEYVPFITASRLKVIHHSCGFNPNPK